MSDFLVKRGELGEYRVAESEAPEVGAGEALLRVDCFGLTANNVTYAVMGEAMSYWDFFPAEQGWGRIPMWGFAEVERSEADRVESGTRVFGDPPPFFHLLVTPAGVDRGGFVDGSPHRAALPSAYHRYLDTGADPFYSASSEDVQMLLRPLFFTSFLIDDQLDDEGLIGAGRSSSQAPPARPRSQPPSCSPSATGVELIGLTSPANAEFVGGLGIYDRCVGYDAIDSLGSGPASFVDIAGDAAVRHAVHSHYGDRLAHSMAVGISHWEDLEGDGEELPGPRPAFFFAPDRVVKRSADWGRAGLESGSPTPGTPSASGPRAGSR